jgi:hypothetical protein
MIPNYFLLRTATGFVGYWDGDMLADRGLSLDVPRSKDRGREPQGGRPMNRHILTVTVPNRRTFDAYWYGVGTVLDVIETAPSRHLTFVVDYGDDGFRAQYQRDRFLSGLYHATVTVEPSHDAWLADMMNRHGHGGI